MLEQLKDGARQAVRQLPPEMQAKIKTWRQLLTDASRGVRNGTLPFDGNVGASFDEYARRWKTSTYSMETSGGAAGIARDEAKDAQLIRPGDEWGEQERLENYYRDLTPTFPEGPLRILEIGSGAGRLTEVLWKLVGDRIETYTTVDVSQEMTQQLEDRMRDIGKVETHVTQGVDLSMFEASQFNLVISQSCWSHVNFYDQYRYLRDLRRVMQADSPFICVGIFLMGLGDDWAWNRFVRRVAQIDNNIPPVYHEFAGAPQLAEMMLRLGWSIESMNTHAFVVRRGNASAPIGKWAEIPYEERTVVGALPRKRPS